MLRNDFYKPQIFTNFSLSQSNICETIFKDTGREGDFFKAHKDAQLQKCLVFYLLCCLTPPS